MPITDRNKSRYPKSWKAISKHIRTVRADNRCEVCGVRNYAVGHREDGAWNPIGGNAEADNLGAGYGTYQEAAAYRDLHNQLMPDQPKLIVIVLTVAHLDHQPENCAESNLKAMCQKCHLDYDAQHHARNAKGTRHAKKFSQQTSLFR